MTLDPLILSRLQFARVIAWHILWPMIVPYKFTLWDAASSASTQAFLAVGTLVLLPVILLYTGWSYWVFRGKVRADIGYH
jgi:cytochrome bd ubiquinol oxidase subunit II